MADGGGAVAKKPRLLADPPFSGPSLEQVARFLVAKELGKTSMVCKTWRDDLKPPAKTEAARTFNEEDEEEAGVVDNSEAIWKQAAQNTNPSVMQAILKSTGSEEEVDFHKLAKGLSLPSPAKLLPKPTFQIDNLLIVAELKERIVSKDKDGNQVVTYKSIGAFACSDCSPLLSHPGEGLPFDTENAPVCFELPNKLCPNAHNRDFLKWNKIWNQFHAELNRWKSRGDQGVMSTLTGSLLFPPFDSCRGGSLVASLFLVRRDDWRSICLFENKLCWVHGNRTTEIVMAFTDRQEGAAWNRQLFAPNDSGIYAQSLANNAALCPLPNLRIIIAAVLPERGSTDEQKWLRELRKTRPADVDWTEEHDKEISDERSFNFRMESMTVYFDIVGDWEETDNEDDFLLLLEGLDWK